MNTRCESKIEELYGTEKMDLPAFGLQALRYTPGQPSPLSVHVNMSYSRQPTQTFVQTVDLHPFPP